MVSLEFSIHYASFIANELPYFSTDLYKYGAVCLMKGVVLVSINWILRELIE
jgi:hypothetical protein